LQKHAPCQGRAQAQSKIPFHGNLLQRVAAASIAIAILPWFDIADQFYFLGIPLAI
jgi:hypothetical protein